VSNAIERATGRWREILPRFGIDPRFLTNKHGPCPMCGGKDRYRFDDRNGSGSYYCNQCGAGTGAILARKYNGWDHRTVCAAIETIIDSGPSKRVDPIVDPPEDRAHKRTAIECLLREADAPEVVSSYLALRGIASSSSVLRGHPACPYYDGSGKYVGRFPAVIAPIVAPDGTLQSDPRKRTMPVVETLKSAAVPLEEPGMVLGVAEGVETALAASELRNIPIWAAVTAHGVETFEPPDGVRELHVFADNDDSFTGQAAAYALAKRIRITRPVMRVAVHVPPLTGTDYNDLLRGHA
jgi:putative DNA primase/helicase